MRSLSVYYQGNDLSAIPGVEVFNHDFNALPTRNIRMNPIARADKSIITSADYTQKDITILCDIRGKTRQESESIITQLKAILQPTNARVRVNQSDSEYRYTATLNEFNITWRGLEATVELVLLASDPVGYETITRELLDVNTTNASATWSQVVGGSFRAQPTFTVTINSVTGGTDEFIRIFNSRTQQGIRLQRDWVADDVLVINSSTKEINVNGEMMDYEGIFPTFAAGTAVIGYQDGFASRDVDVSATYVRRII